MLFLISTPQVVSLEVAAKTLIGEDSVDYLDKSKFKSKLKKLMFVGLFLAFVININLSYHVNCF